MSLTLLEPPPAAAVAPRPAGRKGSAPRPRWPLWTSLGLHVLVAVTAIALHAAPARVTAAPRAADVGIVLPEAPAEQAPDAAPEEELPELLEPPVLAPEVPCEDPTLCEPSLAPFDDIPGPTSEPIPLLPGPTFADVRPRARPTPTTIAVAPAPPAPPAPQPSQVPANVGPRRAAPSPTHAPDLPMDARLAALPRGLVVGLVLTVEQDGHVTDVRVETVSGAPLFDEAARAWVLSRWRFRASPERCRTRVPFRLPRA